MKLLRFLGLFCWLIIFCTLLYPQAAQAHITKTDGSMSVTLHINPQDYPVINVPQQFTFLYDNSQSGFSTEKCDCVMEMRDSSGALILKKDVSAISKYTGGRIPYTFKDTGVYRIYLSGQPITLGSFQPFNINYSIRVATSLPGQTPATTPLSTSKQIAIIVGVSAIILLVLGAVVYQIKRDLREYKE